MKKPVVREETQLLDDQQVIHLGSRVVIKNAESQKVLTLYVVSPAEASLEENKISVDTPLGQALLGRKPEDWITIQAPKGKLNYCVLAVFEN